MTAWKRAVAHAFDRAGEYEAAAWIQAIVADRLAATIAAEPLVPSPHTLEIGCGTGLLTQALHDRIDLGPMLVTDIAPLMLERCQDRFRYRDNIQYLVMDGERPAFRPGFDLVTSSLAAQWFTDLEGALGGLVGLLRPNGLLAVTTLAAGTFREWELAQEANGQPTAMPALPSIEALHSLRFQGCETEIRFDRLREEHVDGMAFLRALRTIGAHTPADPAAVLSAGGLRRALRNFDARGAAVTYVVATCLVRRNQHGVGKYCS